LLHANENSCPRSEYGWQWIQMKLQKKNKFCYMLIKTIVLELNMDGTEYRTHVNIEENWNYSSFPCAIIYRVYFQEK